MKLARALVSFVVMYATLAPWSAAGATSVGAPPSAPPLPLPEPASSNAGPEAPQAGVVNSCTYPALRTALAGGGAVTFSCAGTIVFTATWIVTSNTVLDGNGFKVVLDGADTRPLFEVSNGAKLTVRRLSIEDGRNDINGGCIRAFGDLDLVSSTVRSCITTSLIGSPDGGAIYGSTAVVQLTNTQVTGNYAKGYGGGIYAVSSNLRVFDSDLQDNLAYSGGGVFQTQGTADFRGSRVLSNTATALGGGLYANGVLTYTIDQSSELSHNRVTSEAIGIGGGAYFTQSRPYINDTQIVDNRSQGAAGAIYVGGTAGVIALYSSVISANVALGDGPGGVYLDGGSASVYSNLFRANDGYPYGGALRNGTTGGANTGSNLFQENDGYYGGGIYNDTGSELQVYNTQFISNTGAYGAGLHNDGLIRYGMNLTFIGNVATWRGGALHTDAAKASSYLTDVVMLNNKATQEYGGAIFAKGNVTVSLRNAQVNSNIVGRHGAGIYVDAAYLRVVEADISDNRSTGVTSTSSGMAVYAAGAAKTEVVAAHIDRNRAGYLAQGAALHLEGTALLNNVTVNDNWANGAGHGGAVHFLNADAQIVGAQMRRNIGLYSGGAIYAEDSAIDLYYVDARENQASAVGGGMYAFQSSVNLFDVEFTDHNSGASDGAGVYCYSCTGRWRYPTISRNVATRFGGGLYSYMSSLRIEGGLLDRNGAPDGGAAYLQGGSTLITNTTLSGNWAAQEGGGVYGRVNSGAGTQFTLTNVTIKDNAALSGGGIFIENDAGAAFARGRIRNTVIADSLSGGNCGGKPLSAAFYSLSADFTCSLNTIGATNLPDGSPANLGMLWYNGGYNKSHMPITGSMLIDGVSGAVAPLVDQRGAGRPQGLGFDIGAVEFGVSVPNLVPFFSVYVPSSRREVGADW